MLTERVKRRSNPYRGEALTEERKIQSIFVCLVFVLGPKLALGIAFLCLRSFFLLLCLTCIWASLFVCVFVGDEVYFDKKKLMIIINIVIING